MKFTDHSFLASRNIETKEFEVALEIAASEATHNGGNALSQIPSSPVRFVLLQKKKELAIREIKIYERLSSQLVDREFIPHLVHYNLDTDPSNIVLTLLEGDMLNAEHLATRHVVVQLFDLCNNINSTGVYINDLKPDHIRVRALKPQVQVFDFDHSFLSPLQAEEKVHVPRETELKQLSCSDPSEFMFMGTTAFAAARVHFYLGPDVGTDTENCFWVFLDLFGGTEALPWKDHTEDQIFLTGALKYLYLLDRRSDFPNLYNLSANEFSNARKIRATLARDTAQREIVTNLGLLRRASSPVPLSRSYDKSGTSLSTSPETNPTDSSKAKDVRNYEELCRALLGASKLVLARVATLEINLHIQTATMLPGKILPPAVFLSAAAAKLCERVAAKFPLKQVFGECAFTDSRDEDEQFENFFPKFEQLERGLVARLQEECKTIGDDECSLPIRAVEIGYGAVLAFGSVVDLSIDLLCRLSDAMARYADLLPTLFLLSLVGRLSIYCPPDQDMREVREMAIQHPRCNCRFHISDQPYPVAVRLSVTEPLQTGVVGVCEMFGLDPAEFLVMIGEEIIQPSDCQRPLSSFELTRGSLPALVTAATPLYVLDVILRAKKKPDAKH